MINNDANIELVVSNTLQPMNLIMSDNQVRQSIAHIFINSECKGEKYQDVQPKSKDAVTLFSEILGVQDVKLHFDLPKHEIEKVLEEIHQYAVKFEE